MKLPWKRLIAILASILLAGSAGFWGLSRLNHNLFSVEFDTTQTEADFPTRQEQIDFLSDLTDLKIPASATDISFTKEGWQDHSIIGEFRLPTDHLNQLVDLIPRITSRKGGLYEYQSNDGRTLGRLQINHATGVVNVEAHCD